MTVAPSFEYERNKIIRILAQKAPERLVQALKNVTPLKIATAITLFAKKNQKPAVAGFELFNNLEI